MLLLVHPRFLLVHERKHLEKGKKEEKKLFVLHIYITNKDEDKCANLIPCKQLHNAALGARVMGWR